jgi:hypothetical protein
MVRGLKDEAWVEGECEVLINERARVVLLGGRASRASQQFAAFVYEQDRHGHISTLHI